ncbi:MAG: AbrB/MazE/SpoVT family DNA-binding domain-containing protein [Dysosmobacter sp.]|nr:AbrB/MazE/SpoVT family DNA-binding domain-containing protein [Dysosmobacter sp.]
MKEPKGRFAGTVRVGEKGQIVIPKGARDLLNIQPGDTLLVLADEKRGIAITKDDVLLRQFEALLGPEEPS